MGIYTFLWHLLPKDFYCTYYSVSASVQYYTENTLLLLLIKLLNDYFSFPLRYVWIWYNIDKFA